MWTRTQRAQVLPVARVYNNDAWKDLTAQAAYNTSASFLAWLLDTYGADRLRQIYGAPAREFADSASTRCMHARSNRWRRTGCGSVNAWAG